MLVKNIVEEDFINYKLPSMFIATCFCDWKCCHEQNLDISVCQNSDIAKQPNINISDKEIFKRYISNPITKAIVIGGLEPFRQFDEVYSLIKYFRDKGCKDTFIIYTGYNKDEIINQIEQMKTLNNIILKVGRYIPNNTPHYDELLGIKLASDNQKGVIIC